MSADVQGGTEPRQALHIDIDNLLPEEVRGLCDFLTTLVRLACHGRDALVAYRVHPSLTPLVTINGTIVQGDENSLPLIRPVKGGLQYESRWRPYYEPGPSDSMRKVFIYVANYTFPEVL
jgi:hypothetical protein